MSDWSGFDGGQYPGLYRRRRHANGAVASVSVLRHCCMIHTWFTVNRLFLKR